MSAVNKISTPRSQYCDFCRIKCYCPFDFLNASLKGCHLFLQSKKRRQTCSHEGIETSDSNSVAFVNALKYTQYSPQTEAGFAGLLARIRTRLSKPSPCGISPTFSPTVDSVFGHTEYGFRMPRVRFWGAFRKKSNRRVFEYPWKICSLVSGKIIL